jgi:glycosyltransferase involved in cell wall biosynthesis
MSPKISVIVPVYNVERYLCQCIESILHQTFTDFELILIDDGSIDNSGLICDEYARKDNRIRIFHKKNEGVSIARNLGLENALGEWITFVDSDDWIDNYLFQTYINNISSDVDSIVVGLIEEHQERKSIRTLSESKCLDMINALLLLEYSGYYGFVWNRLYKSSIIQENHIMFDPKISFCEDHLFTYEYNRYSSKISILKEAPYHHRILKSGTLSTKNSFDMIIDEAEQEKTICYSIYRKYPVEEFMCIINNTYKGRLRLAFYSIFHNKYSFRERMRNLKIIRRLENKDTDYVTLIIVNSYFSIRPFLGRIKRKLKEKFVEIQF